MSARCYFQHLKYYRNYICFTGSPGFFREISRTWKILENEFGPGRSWKDLEFTCDST